MTNEQLFLEFRQALAAAALARERGEEETLRRLEDTAREAQMRLWEQVLPFVHYLVRKYARPNSQRGVPVEREDLVHEAYLKFDALIRRYDLAEEGALIRVLGAVLRRHYHDCLFPDRTRAGAKAPAEPVRPARREVYLEEETSLQPSQESHEEKIISEDWKKSVKKLVAEALASLNAKKHDPLKRAAFLYYYSENNLTLEQIAALLGRSVTWAHGAVADTGQKIRLYIETVAPDVAFEIALLPDRPPERRGRRAGGLQG